MSGLDNKVIIVTGASSGIGAATARLLAAKGAKVVIAARRRDKGEAVLRDIEAAGGDGLFVQTDVTREADVEALVAATLARYGRLDGAVNNAGITGPTLTPLAEVPLAGFEAVIDTNLKGVFLCMKSEIPAMLANGGGAIVNTASTAGVKPSFIGHAPYSASKFAVIGLTQSAAVDYGQKGMRINAVCPGFVHSELVDPYLEAAPELMASAVGRSSAMNRVGDASEIAEATAWLLSDAASFVNGAALVLDGGDTTRMY